MGKGILVDAEGYFLGAYRWADDEVPPNFNEPRSGEARVADENRLFLLTSEEAIAVNNSTGRWDFKAKSWSYPTEERWLVKQRRDLPDLWVLSGKKLVWPNRLPRLPEGTKLVSVAPPILRSKKPIWRDSTEEWLTSQAKYVCDASGVVLNVVASYIPEDIPTPTDGYAIDEGVAGPNEIDETVPVSIGDEIAPDGTPKINRKPNYNRVPVRILEDVLTENNLGAAFVAFVESKGYAIGQVRDLETISLGNKLLREFVLAQGFTLKQAYTALQKRAEELNAAEASILKEIGDSV